MAYRKTPAIEAGIAARRDRLVAAALAIIGKRGADELRVGDVATRARLAHGLPYKYFADKTELIAAVVERLRAKHVRAIEGAETIDDALKVIYSSMGSQHLNALIWGSPVYRAAISEALGRFLAPHLHVPLARAKIASAMILGAARGMHEAVEGAPRGRVMLAAFVQPILDSKGAEVF